ncbi:uncharacterized protein CMC5_009680 [Chondromyces crocatus]|uniref:Uncharacterized protein n=1 Tax=Chondromyces crocatus TaxID=52 RepID=A0A0K1E837_CHOCO|nr:uncharacterized protein CMC5_009680 [Chondromyces crocatus]
MTRKAGTAMHNPHQRIIAAVRAFRAYGAPWLIA